MIIGSLDQNARSRRLTDDKILEDCGGNGEEKNQKKPTDEWEIWVIMYRAA